MITVARQMWREHLPGYATVVAAVLAATTLTSALLTVAVSSSRPRDGDILERQAASDLAGLTSTVTSWSVGVTVFATAFVLAGTTAFALDARARELGLLRLVGASPRQVATLVRIEALGCALVGGTAGAVLGWPAALLVHRALAGTGFADPAVQPGAPVGAAGGALAVALAVTLVGTLGPARRAGRTDPVTALGLPGGARRAMTPARWVLAVAGVGGGAALLASAPGGDVGGQLTLIVGVSLLVLTGITAAAPIVVPAVARALGGPLRIAFPAAGLLAQAAVGHHARRTAALAAPILLVVGTYAAVGTISATSNAMPGPGADRPAVLLTGSGLTAHALLELCAARSDVAACSPVADLGGVVDDGTGTRTAYVRVLDPATAHALGTIVTRGSLGDIAGEVVGGGDLSARSGGRLAYTDPGGVTHRVTIGPTIEVIEIDASYATLYLSFEQTRDWGLDVEADLWALPAAGADEREVANGLAAAAGEGRALTRADWADERAADRAAENRRGMLALFGAAELLAGVAVVLTCAASARDRVAAYGVLHRCGARVRQIVGAAAGEVLLVAAVAAAGAVWIPLFAAARLERVAPGTTAVVPWPELGVLFSLASALALATTVVSTTYHARRAAGAA